MRLQGSPRGSYSEHCTVRIVRANARKIAGVGLQLAGFFKKRQHAASVLEPIGQPPISPKEIAKEQRWSNRSIIGTLWRQQPPYTMEISDTDELSTFASVLRRYRLDAGLSQEDLAERARLSSVSISALERGTRRAPYRATVAALAQALALTAFDRTRLEVAAARSGPTRILGPNRNAIDPGRRTNLPIALSSFFGRKSELADIIAMLDTERLITLTGAGGVGKTRTAIEIGAAVAEKHPDGAWFVELAPLVNPSLVAPAILFALRNPESTSLSALEALVGVLQNKALVLLLDNCEHVIAEAATVTAALLRGCPKLRIVATCREPLRLAGERVYRIPSLAVPAAAPSVSAAEATQYEAIALFTECARSVDHRFALTDKNAPVIAAICRRLDGIPLAIECVAARVTILSVEALCERLSRRFALLSGADQGAPPRHQTMRALIDWSFDLLSASEQRFFVRLSIFSDGCSVAAAAAVCASMPASDDDPDTLNILSSLVDKSLVVADLERDEPRYRLLEASREYGREKLLASDEAFAVRRSHAWTYLDIAERFERGYQTAPDSRWFASAEAELQNWQAALQWSLGTGEDVALGQRLVGALWPVWKSFATTEGRRWIEAARKHIDERTPLSVVARIEFAEGNIGFALREHRVGLACMERATTLYRSLGDDVVLLRAQTLTGCVLTGIGRFSDAEPLLLECLARGRASGDHMLVAGILRALGVIRGDAGNLSAARAALGEARALFAAASADRDSLQVMLTRAEVEFRAGDSQAALHHASEALEKLGRFDAMREAATPAVILSNMTAYLVVLNRYDEAETRAHQALEIAREQQHNAAAAWTLQHLAAISILRPQDPDFEPPDVLAERAARVLGFVDARIHDFGSPRQYTERQEYERIIERLQDTLGAARLRDLLTEGTAITQDEAIETVLAC
jgi:predicted ATPase/DNA-binding XRE family transcriptional regulator